MLQKNILVCPHPTPLPQMVLDPLLFEKSKQTKIHGLRIIVQWILRIIIQAFKILGILDDQIQLTFIVQIPADFNFLISATFFKKIIQNNHQYSPDTLLVLEYSICPFAD